MMSKGVSIIKRERVRDDVHKVIVTSTANL